MLVINALKLDLLNDFLIYAVKIKNFVYKIIRIIYIKNQMLLKFSEIINFSLIKLQSLFFVYNPKHSRLKDDFDNFIIDRAKNLVKKIENNEKSIFINFNNPAIK